MSELLRFSFQLRYILKWQLGPISLMVFPEVRFMSVTVNEQSETKAEQYNLLHLYPLIRFPNQPLLGNKINGGFPDQTALTDWLNPWKFC